MTPYERENKEVERGIVAAIIVAWSITIAVLIVLAVRVVLR